MSRDKVFTYEKSKLKHYIDCRSEINIPVVTLAQIEKKGLDHYIVDEESYLDIDLTSAVKLIVDEKIAVSYGLEELIGYFDSEIYDNICFIIDERYEQDLMNSLPYFFESAFPLEKSKGVDVGYKENEEGKDNELIRIVDLNDEKVKSLFKLINLDIIGHTALKKMWKERLVNSSFFITELKTNQLCLYF